MLIRILLLLSAVVLFISCSETKEQQTNKKVETKSLKKKSSAFERIKSFEHFKNIIDTEHSLVVADFYADWCMPCRKLEPVLDEVAGAFRGSVKFLKINVTDNQKIAAKFKVQSIPYVVLIKDRKIVQTMRGFRPKNEYMQAISAFSD